MSKIIVLTVDHSNTGPDAINDSDHEVDLVQGMYNIVASILHNDYGLAIRTNGEEKGDLPLRKTAKLIHGSDVTIEFHTNAAASRAAMGVETLSTPKNRRWYQVLNRAVANVTDWKLCGDSGFKPDNTGQHSHLAYAQAGGIVFKPFFISNDADLKFFKERKQAICRTIATAIAVGVGTTRV